MTDKEIIELIQRRRRQLTVHSYGYYRLNDNIIPDATFDLWSKELVELQTKYPELAKKAPLHFEFKDFDGSTGFDLPMGEPWVASLWFHLKNEHKKRGM